MSAADGDTAAHLDTQPHAIVERDGVRYTLLGTAHVSRASIDAVRAEVASGRYDGIAVELDAQRHRALTDPQALARLDLFQIIREGKIGLVAANLALAAYQRRLAEQLGVKPGDPLTLLVKQDLDPLSVEELHARIAILEGEIARVKAKIEAAVNHRASADAIFRK